MVHVHALRPFFNTIKEAKIINWIISLNIAIVAFTLFFLELFDRQGLDNTHIPNVENWNSKPWDFPTESRIQMNHFHKRQLRLRGKNEIFPNVCALPCSSLFLFFLVLSFRLQLLSAVKLKSSHWKMNTMPSCEV